MAIPGEAVFLRPGTQCDVHDWPTEGIGHRLVEAMREKHGSGGVNACRPCLERAREDAAEKAPLGPRRVYVRFDFDTAKVELVSSGERTRAWLETPAVSVVTAGVLRPLLGLRMTKDPGERSAPPPAGFVWPSLLAAQLERALRDAFPEEDIAVRPYRSPR